MVEHVIQVDETIGEVLAEVNISSYPGTDVPGLFFFCRAEVLNSGGFVQKYSDQGVSCKNIGQWHVPMVKCLLRENQMVH